MTAELGATYSHSLHVATITLPTVTIPLGPVPLAVTMSVPIEAGFSATLEANGAFKMNSASSGSLTYGFEYTPSGGLEWLHENTMTHVAPPVYVCGYGCTAQGGAGWWRGGGAHRCTVVLLLLAARLTVPATKKLPSKCRCG